MLNEDKEFGGFLNDERDRITMLDRALEDATPVQKARVREVVRRLDIDDDNEFYIVVIAIGYLVVLVKDAPERWQELFDAFEEKLGEWATENLRTLAAINHQSELTERMSKSFLSLVTSTDSLKRETKASGALSMQLSASLRDAIGRLGKTEGYSRELSQRFKQTEQRVSQLEKLVTLTSACSLGLLLMLSVGGAWAFRRIEAQNQTIGAITAGDAERSRWMLEKANREECYWGIKPRSDEQCQ